MVPSRPAEKWQHEPTSTAAQPDRVPSKSLPPLSSMDRMATGEHLGQCRTCGGHQWWDNRARKAMGEMSRSQPDYVCTDCRHGRWIDGRQRSGWAVPTGYRTPPVRVTVVAPVVEPEQHVAATATPSMPSDAIRERSVFMTLSSRFSEARCGRSHVRVDRRRRSSSCS